MSDMNEESHVGTGTPEVNSASVPQATNKESSEKDVPGTEASRTEASEVKASQQEVGVVAKSAGEVVAVPVAASGGGEQAELATVKKVETPVEKVVAQGSGSYDEASGRSAELEMGRLSRRSFLWAGVAIAAGYAGWWAIDKSPDIDGVKAPFRRGLEFDERVGRLLFSQSRLAPTFDRSLAQVPKPNGGYGLGTALVPSEWSLMVEGLYGRAEVIELKMADILALPKVEMVTEHKCIEGWSTIVHWGGARFVDFAAKYLPATIDGSAPDIHGKQDRLMPYVSLTTPDEEYYVGLDIESALHPQTLLCYEMNGEPLTEEHGAPLRLVIPLKYGIKAIKRIGKIVYTKTRPDDYWAKLGYDWYAGH